MARLSVPGVSRLSELLAFLFEAPRPMTARMNPWNWRSPVYALLVCWAWRTIRLILTDAVELLSGEARQVGRTHELFSRGGHRREAALKD